LKGGSPGAEVTAAVRVSESSRQRQCPRHTLTISSLSLPGTRSSRWRRSQASQWRRQSPAHSSELLLLLCRDGRCSSCSHSRRQGSRAGAGPAAPTGCRAPCRGGRGGQGGQRFGGRGQARDRHDSLQGRGAVSPAAAASAAAEAQALQAQRCRGARATTTDSHGSARGSDGSSPAARNSQRGVPAPSPGRPSCQRQRGQCRGSGRGRGPRLQPEDTPRGGLPAPAIAPAIIIHLHGGPAAPTRSIEGRRRAWGRLGGRCS